MKDQRKKPRVKTDLEQFREVALKAAKISKPKIAYAVLNSKDEVCQMDNGRLCISNHKAYCACAVEQAKGERVVKVEIRVVG